MGVDQSSDIWEVSATFENIFLNENRKPNLCDYWTMHVDIYGLKKIIKNLMSRDVMGVMKALPFIISTLLAASVGNVA